MASWGDLRGNFYRSLGCYAKLPQAAARSWSPSSFGFAGFSVASNRKLDCAQQRWVISTGAIEAAPHDNLPTENAGGRKMSVKDQVKGMIDDATGRENNNSKAERPATGRP
jgi:hypothetical protein